MYAVAGRSYLASTRVRRPLDQQPPRAARRGRRDPVRVRLDLPARQRRGEPRRRHAGHRSSGPPRSRSGRSCSATPTSAAPTSGSPVSCGRPTSALLPMGGAVSQVAGPNWALIGDAAACVNPLNGEGIDYGLETGRLVVEVMGEHDDLSTVWPGAAAGQLRRGVLDRAAAGRPGHPARAAAHPRTGRHALGLADDPGPALDGQPGRPTTTATGRRGSGAGRADGPWRGTSDRPSRDQPIVRPSRGPLG